MKIFLDTANLADIKKYAAWGIVDGVTTNPTLMAKEGVNFEKRIKDIAEVVDGPISAETVSEDAKGMVEEGKEYAAWHPNVIIKVPTTAEGLIAVQELAREGIRCNVTLCFSANQALLVAKAGAFIVSPFVGRLDDIGENGMNVIEEIVTIYRNYKFETQVLVASVRNPEHVAVGAKLGADIATVPVAVLDQMIRHPLTDKGIEKFLEDWKSVKEKK